MKQLIFHKKAKTLKKIYKIKKENVLLATAALKYFKNHSKINQKLINLSKN